MRFFSWLGAACVLAGLSVPCTAAAQGKAGAPKAAPKGAPQKGGKDAAPKEETPKDKAASFMKNGAKAAASGDWDDAYAEYAIAWSIDPSWETAAAIGKAAYKTGHFAEAIRRLEFYLSQAPAEKVSAKDKTETDGILADAKAKTGAITITGPDGGEVIVDGDSVGKTPLVAPIQVDPGSHKVEVRRGSQGETRTADITAGAKVTLDFTPPKAGPPEKVIVKEEGVFTPQVRTAAVIGGGALALAGIAAGGVMLGVSFAKDDELKKAQLDPFGQDAAKGAAQAKSDALNASLWCFVGGGVAAVGTTVFYLVTRPKVKAPVNAGAFVGPKGPSIWIEGQF